MDFAVLAQQCAPAVHPQTMRAVVQVESSFNPLAIGVVGGELVRQPVNKPEAVATAKALEAAGYNFSLGVGQVNRFNLAKYGLTVETAFDPCQNLRAAAGILAECFARAQRSHRSNSQEALQAAFSCYYSGNFQTGFQHGYVRRVLTAWVNDATNRR